MTVNIHPRSLDSYRQGTESRKAMACSCFSSFLCPECNKHKATKGRKSRGYKIGFRCADCVKRRAESRAAKQAMSAA